MPKDIIDYSNTIIYKIYCNDSSVTDIYVGHTTNFIKRKHQHKVLCNNSNKLKIYDMIRKNGGWNNWTMVEIAKYFCQDVTEARIKEQEHYELLKQSLKIANPILNNKNCILNIDKPLLPEQDDNLIQFRFYCKYCDYSTNKKCNYDEHLMTQKHISKTFKLEINQNQQKAAKTAKIFSCEKCLKIYKDNSGLWRHKKKCKTNNNFNNESDCEDDTNIKEHTILDKESKNLDKESTNSDKESTMSDKESTISDKESTISDKELIMMLVKQNNELLNVLKNLISSYS